MGFWLGLAGIVGVFVALDRVAVWAENRGWIHWRRMGGGNGGAGLFNAAQTLINPSNRHLVEEQHRMQMTRRTENADGAPFVIDTDRGVIQIQSAPTEPATGDGHRRP
ncbi:DUF6191 domain-containing protein [Nocardia sp. R6R-6]|uniref:DUF6191 domain-containing protein n=1 Tax=Nocardia sp. R6R-6 TaxID=3459303 RepID=UPI00403D63C9